MSEVASETPYTKLGSADPPQPNWQLWLPAGLVLLFVVGSAALSVDLAPELGPAAIGEGSTVVKFCNVAIILVHVGSISAVSAPIFASI